MADYIPLDRLTKVEISSSSEAIKNEVSELKKADERISDRVEYLEDTIPKNLSKVNQSLNDLSTQASNNLKGLMKYYKENDRRYWQRHESELNLMRSIQYSIGELQRMIVRITIMVALILVIVVASMLGLGKYNKLLSDYNELAHNYNQLCSEYIDVVDTASDDIPTIEIENTPT